MSDSPSNKNDKKVSAPTRPERDPRVVGDAARRPTRPPPGDPITFAREIMGARKPTPESRAATRSPQQTITNEQELEDARVRSMKLSEPPVATSNPSLLSLANAHASGSLAVPGLALSGATTTTAAATSAKTDASISSQIGEMRDRFSLGDYSGALVVSEAILESEPKQTEALQVAQHCRRTLEQMYIARIGPLTRVPMVGVPRDQLRWLSIDHRAGFLLSHVDGVSTLELILDVSGMSPLDALRILFELAQQRVITFR